MDDANAPVEERAALVALLGEAAAADPRLCTGWSAIASEVVRRGSALAVWNQRHPLSLDGPGESDGALLRARDRMAGWRTAGIDLLTVLDGRYPLQLRRVQHIPSVLFVRGQLLADEVGVSVVGSRQGSVRGHRMTTEIARGLIEREISVISGLALGIDTAAHQATVSAGGRPIGLLGTGINRVYPAQNRHLHDRVAAAGALVSQFMPDAPPDKHAFPMRNATMSGLGRASVIVEAGEYSGSRILGRLSLEQGRPLILTGAVVTSTQWGAELADRAGVYVASTTAQVLDIVDEVVCDVDAGT